MTLASFWVVEIPVIVFDLFTKGNLFKIVNGEQIGTLVHS